MEFINKYKLQVILLALLAILIGIVLFIFFMFVYHTDNQSKYGSRLDGIESVRIDNTYFDGFKEEQSENESIISIDSNISGRIINMVITFSEEVTIDDALLIHDDILEYFDDDNDVLEFYEIQVFLKSNDAENENFPAIGYKHHTNDKFIWTNNIEI